MWDDVSVQCKVHNEVVSVGINPMKVRLSVPPQFALQPLLQVFLPIAFIEEELLQPCEELMDKHEGRTCTCVSITVLTIAGG